MFLEQFSFLEQISDRNRRLLIFHKTIDCNLALPIENIFQPVLPHIRRIDSKASNAMHTSKPLYEYSLFPRAITGWNSQPGKIATKMELPKIN